MARVLVRLGIGIALAVAAVAWWRRPQFADADLDLPQYDPRLWEWLNG